MHAARRSRSLPPLRTDRGRRRNHFAAALPLLALAACGGSGPTTPRDQPQGQFELASVQFGRLVDVYALNAAGSIELYERDVVVAATLEDERPATSLAPDAQITYDFLANDPDTLQPRLLIPRAPDSDEFRAAFDALDDDLREVTPMRDGEGGPGLPYPVVPRNAAVLLRFTGAIGVDDAWFVQRDENGSVNGLRNTEAVQLLRIVAGGTGAAFAPVPVRVVAKPRALVLDPVLLGSEGLQYQTINNPAGLPPSPDQLGANLRIALALDGPLALPGLRPGTNELTGPNNGARPSVVRDFRSGNAADSSADLTRGFLRDTLPLRLLGDIPMHLERVEQVSAVVQEITVWKNGAVHEIDRGDTFRLLEQDGELIGASEVVSDPIDDRDDATVQHVRVRIRAIPGLAAHDPRRLPGYPENVSQREPWLLANAPLAVCVCEFTAGGDTPRDDPRNFVRFSPESIAVGGVKPGLAEHVSPFASALVRFSKPVDLATVRWADTFFFAMRDLADEAAIEQFVAQRPNGTATPGLEPAAFDVAKYRTPFLIASRVFDEDGSQTTLRLTPSQGLYLDAAMRQAPPGADHRYFLHLFSDSAVGGVRDLAGNRLDLQGSTQARASRVVIPFTVDTRVDNGVPVAPDNLVVSVVRTFASRDEDENPSWYLADEVQPPGAAPRGKAFPLADVFGACVYVDGRLQARPATRTRVIADNLNQSPVVQPSAGTAPQSPLASCPQTVNGQAQGGSNTATNVLNQGIQNPLNPSGCRLQTLWREIDLSLSRTDPFDFDLDIEGMFWAPYTGTNLQFDEFDATRLELGHAEYRPAPCVGNTSALPSLPESGLRQQFERNFAWNPAPTGSGTNEASRAPRVVAYADAALTINPAEVVREPNGVNRYLPLPTFRKPYFVWRDQTVMEQGCNSGIGSDLTATPGYAPYVASPFANGQGRQWIDLPGPNGVAAEFVDAYWNDAPGFRLGSPSAPDAFTGGLVGSIALPLLADFQTTCDSAALPAGDPYVALGTNGWQVAITVQSNALPRFRAYSAGRPPAAPQGGDCMSTSSQWWTLANGGWAPGATTSANWSQTAWGDNTFYWVMLDVVRRQTVVTAGFVDLFDPHRLPPGSSDPRLGPFFLSGGTPVPPAGVLPRLAYEFDPPLSRLPAGTSVVPQFRAAGRVDPSPWYWNAWMSTPNVLFPAPGGGNPGFDAAAREEMRPSARNLPLDPFKAGDAHIRKWDARGGRNAWTHFYNRVVTRYVEDPNELFEPAFVAGYSVTTDPFTAADIRYVNWRFVMGSNVDVEPAVAPAIDTFALSYRFRAQ